MGWFLSGLDRLRRVVSTIQPFHHTTRRFWEKSIFCQKMLVLKDFMLKSAFFFTKNFFFQKRRVAWQNGFKVETTCLSRSKPDRNQPMKICSSLKKSIFKKKKDFFCLFLRGGVRGYHCFSFLGRGVLHKEFLHIPKELSFHEKCFVLWTFYLKLHFTQHIPKTVIFSYFRPKNG